MKKWNNPELKNLSLENTNEDGAGTYDLPHPWICKKCGAHYRGPLQGGDRPCVPCDCGKQESLCDWEYSWCTPPESGVYVQP